MSQISRRDFLKLYAALAASAALSGVPRLLPAAHSNNGGKPNILIFVFDCMSAPHLSLYGYGRKTTPHLEKFAERASVYHNHHSSGNFTTPATASMLTGMHPWTHRALNFRGMIDRALADRNLFKLVGDEYTRLAFTQNFWADILLSQFGMDLEAHPVCDLYGQARKSLFQADDLPADRTVAYYVIQDFLSLRLQDPNSFPGSLVIGSAELGRALLSENTYNVSVDYPRGLPTVHDFSYENADVFSGLRDLIKSELLRSSPLLAYLHFWSPHGPYNVHRDFVGIFNDDLEWHSKPHHPFAVKDYSQELMRQRHIEYDEAIAEVDAEFGRVLSDLEKSGALQNSYVIVTSDHGELFERGEIGHASDLMYAPVTHIPLLISAPGQTVRSDFHSPTSIEDFVPTILKIAGKEIPDWIEGRLLPGFGGTEDDSRSLFPLVARDNATFRPIKRATFTLLRGGYEMFFFTGYPKHPDAFELYNLQEDPNELQDLFSKDITTASKMKEELLEAIDTANRNYHKK